MSRDEDGRQGNNNRYGNGGYRNDNNNNGHRRGHQNGAFRHLNDPKSHAPGGHRVGSPSQQAQNDLGNLGNASGLNGKLNDISRGIGEIGKKDPNLERLGNGLGSAKSLGSGLAGAGRGTGDNGLQGKPNEKAMQSGLADPDKQPERQHGDPSKQPAGNGIGDQGKGSGDDNPLKKYGSSMPQQLANLGGKAHKTYNKFMGGLAGGVQKAGKLAHLTVGKGTAMWVAKMLMCTTLVGGLFGAAYLYENDDDVLFGGNVCSTQNTGDQSYEGTSGGSGGDWMTPGTKAYKNAKASFEAWTRDIGFSGAAAAGAVGWANSEGGWAIVDRAEGHFGSDDKTNGIAYGVTPTPSGAYSVGGGGIYQFTPYTKFAPLNDKKWLSMEAQNKFVAKSLSQGDWISSHDLTGQNHSLKQFAHESDPKKAALEWNAYERGDASVIPKDRKQADAQQVFSAFHGSSIKADDSKLNSILGSSNESTATANADTAEQLNNLNCQGKDQGDVVAGDWDWPFTGFDPDKDVSGPQLFGHAPGGGFRPNGFHDGIDIGTATHSGDMHAIHGGVVKKIDCQGSSQSDLGYYILIESPDGYCEVYQEFAFSMADGSRVSKVKVGDHVKTGQTIARLDPTTPNCTHVHIGVYKGKASDWQTAIHHSFDEWHWQNPIEIIKKSKGK